METSLVVIVVLAALATGVGGYFVGFMVGKREVTSLRAENKKLKQDYQVLSLKYKAASMATPAVERSVLQKIGDTISDIKPTPRPKKVKPSRSSSRRSSSSSTTRSSRSSGGGGSLFSPATFLSSYDSGSYGGSSSSSSSSSDCSSSSSYSSD